MTTFKLPIPTERKLKPHIINDLGLIESYNKLLQPETQFGKDTIKMWTNHYTDDKEYLKQTQQLLSKSVPKLSHDSEKTLQLWKNVKNIDASNNDDGGFCAKYQYIDWPFLEKYNNNKCFLQVLSMYNMTAPIFSLCLPIILLIIPFLIIRVQGFNITVSKYFEILKWVLKRHQIGQLFTISSTTFDKQIYIIASFVFYVIGVYQNIRSCVNFYKNMRVIHDSLFTIKKHIEQTITHMEWFETNTKQFSKYEEFIANMKINRQILDNYKNEISAITPYKISIQKFMQIGNVMKLFYQLHHNSELQTAIEYSFGYCGFIDNICGIQKSIREKILGKCKFTKKSTKFTEAYYPITEKSPIKNTYDTENHMLITGPNAAGKTTLLKSTLFNIIFSQQIGYGCYKKANINPYQYIHCYINIPDTTGRDSLFQAEARRCREIIDVVEEDDESRHFCIFDELYSGTNPYEAVGSAVSFLKYLNKYRNVSFMITTHFIDLCDRLDKEERFKNYHMMVNIDKSNEFTYSYKLINDISDIKGGVKVLKDLEYPEEIINDTKMIIKELR